MGTGVGAIATARGCGASRQAGGIYIECGLSEDGMPLEHFIIDPPVPVDCETLGLSAQGIALVNIQGTVHAFDWVGAVHYPNVADFLEEVRRFGLSRRAQRNLDFTRLGPESSIILVHSRAIIAPDEREAYYRGWYETHDDAVWPCPKGMAEHQDEAGRVAMGGVPLDWHCAGVWWQDVTGGTPVGDRDWHDERKVIRPMPSFTYQAMCPPDGVARDRYAPGLFLRLPISRLAVVADTETGTHEQALEKARKANLPVDLVPE